MILWLACAPGPGEGETGGPAPDLADPDADGLGNDEERALGTDPSSPDTDGDGYLDGDEAFEGTDPTSASSVIYRGGWPYVRDKDGIGRGGWKQDPAVGVRFPRLVAVDQYGDMVDLYDFAGTPVVIDASTLWCGICEEQAAWLAGAPDASADRTYPGVRALVDSGAVRWVTVITEDGGGAPAVQEDVAWWDEAFPHPLIPVLADTDGQLVDWLHLNSYPTLVLVDGDMRITAWSRFDGYDTVLRAMSAMAD
jgi:hypothetical protein